MSDMEDTDISSMTSQLLQNPQLLAAISHQLNGLVGTTSGLIESLPESVKRRLLALKKLQRDHLKVELEYHAAIARIDEEFAEKFKPLYNQRNKIVTGEHEPTAEELDHAPLVPPGDSSDEDEDDEEEKAEDEGEGQKEGGKAEGEAGDAQDVGKGDQEPKKEKRDKNANESAEAHKAGEEMEAEEDGENTEDPQGIPDFWLTALNNHEMIAELVQDEDREALSYMSDIRTRHRPNNSGFELTFVFRENPFFTNTELKKTYHLDPAPESDDDLVYEGPVFQKAVGTTIDWKKDKDVTVKVVKQKQRKSRGRNAGQVRTVLKKIPRPSFFNFFSPPQVDENEETPEVIQTATQLLNQDYEIGEIIRDSIIPRAVLWFTGEANDYEDMGMGSSDDEEEEEEEEGDGSDFAAAQDRIQALFQGAGVGPLAVAGGDDEDEEDEADAVGSASRRKQKAPRRRRPGPRDDAEGAGDEDADEDDEDDEDWKPSNEKPPECKQS